MKIQRAAIRPVPTFDTPYKVRRDIHRQQYVWALMITVILHLIGAFFLIQSIQEHIVEDDVVQVEWVELPPPARTLVKTRQIDRQVKVRNDTEALPAQANPVVLPVISATEIHEPPSLKADAFQSLRVAELETQERGDTETRLPNSPVERKINRGSYTRSARGIDPRAPITRGAHRGGTEGRSSGSDLAIASDTALGLKNERRVPKNRLGAILEGKGLAIRGHIRLIRLKHSLSDWWQDPSAIPSFAKWLEENTDLSVDMKYAGGSLLMTDPRILDAPMIIMTGHDKDITVGRNLGKGGPLTNSFSDAERAALRKYIVERGGMFFFDDCGFNGLLAATVANELYRTFPEYPLKNMMHTHKIYSIYYDLPRPPTGGDVFWGSENHPKASQFKYQKGITINNRLRAVYNRKDYMCAMETVEIESRTMLRMRRSTDVHRFMTNLLIYTMKYGGNTDRSGYKP